MRVQVSSTPFVLALLLAFTTGPCTFGSAATLKRLGEQQGSEARVAEQTTTLSKYEHRPHHIIHSFAGARHRTRALHQGKKNRRNSAWGSRHHRRTSSYDDAGVDKVREWREEVREENEQKRQHDLEERRARERYEQEEKQQEHQAEVRKMEMRHRKHVRRLQRARAALRDEQEPEDELPPIPQSEPELMHDLVKIADSPSITASQGEEEPLRFHSRGEKRGASWHHEGSLHHHLRKPEKRDHLESNKHHHRKHHVTKWIDPEHRWRNFVKKARHRYFSDEKKRAKPLKRMKEEMHETKEPMSREVMPFRPADSQQVEAVVAAPAAVPAVSSAATRATAPPAEDHAEESAENAEESAAAPTVVPKQLGKQRRHHRHHEKVHAKHSHHHRGTKKVALKKPVPAVSPPQSDEDQALQAFHRSEEARARAKARELGIPESLPEQPEEEEEETEPSETEAEVRVAAEPPVTEQEKPAVVVGNNASEPASTQPPPQKEANATTAEMNKKLVDDGLVDSAAALGATVPLDEPVQVGPGLLPGEARGPQYEAWADSARSTMRADEDSRALRDVEAEAKDAELDHWVADRAVETLAHPDYTTNGTPEEASSNKNTEGVDKLEESAERLAKELPEEKKTEQQGYGRVSPERKWGAQHYSESPVALRAAREAERLERLQETEQAQYDAENAQELAREASEVAEGNKDELETEEQSKDAEALEREAEEAKRNVEETLARRSAAEEEAQAEERAAEEERQAKEKAAEEAEVENASETEQADEDQFADAFGNYVKEKRSSVPQPRAEPQPAAAAVVTPTTSNSDHQTENASQTEPADEDQFAEAFGNYVKEKRTQPQPQPQQPPAEASSTGLARDVEEAEADLHAWHKSDDIVERETKERENKDALRQAKEAEEMARRDQENAEDTVKEVEAAASQAEQELDAEGRSPAAKNQAPPSRPASEEERDYEAQEKAAENLEAPIENPEQPVIEQAPIMQDGSAPDGAAHALPGTFDAAEAADAAGATGTDPGVTDSAKPDPKAFDRMTFDASKGFREQGIVGKVVKHEDKVSVTSDWGLEYGKNAEMNSYEEICRRNPKNPWCRRHGFLKPKVAKENDWWSLR